MGNIVVNYSKRSSEIQKEIRMGLTRMVIMEIPMIIASVILFVASVRKLGKGKGSGMIMAGAVGLMAMTIGSPVFYSFLVPQIMETLDVVSGEDVYTIIGFSVNLLWAASIGLIAVGTLARKPAVSQQNYIPPVPGEYEPTPYR